MSLSNSLMNSRWPYCSDTIFWPHPAGLAGDTSDASGGSSLASTPTPADSSYSQGPVEVSNPLQQQQQLYLQAQAQRVVQQHSVATQGNTTAQQFHHAAPGDVASQSVGSSLELTAGLNLDQLRSHSQLLLMQQQSQHNMQLMVHKKESGELSANSSWDGMGGLKGFMTNLAGKHVPPLLLPSAAASGLCWWSAGQDWCRVQVR